MHVRYSLLASQATTALFVLLWGSAGHLHPLGTG
ncbi:drug/metabolite transporter permease [Klebsiella pneumoniae]|uniref:Drug/metabolite transporter permease n=1 Tax=Klebsiella pneumoniae TaxID=573 RepID=A0A447S0L5_KLEPN|nr:drug/metabolite transporter permease [Klebsiella pneumoniae]